jgi:galactose mutarotase-like enzyme
MPVSSPQIDAYHCGDAAIAVAPAFGCNCFRWRIGGRELFYAPPGFPTAGDRCFAGGNPVLFPAVGRTWDTSLTPPAPGRYQLAGAPRPYEMPLHGVLGLGDWRAGPAAEGSDAVAVAYAFEPAPAVAREYYPFDVAFSIRYTLAPASLAVKAEAVNRGDMPAPAAFGLHPYFAVADRAQAEIALPCDARLALDPELLVPVGREPWAGGVVTLPAAEDCDQVFSGSESDAVKTAVLRDPAADTAVRVEASGSLCDWVIYSPAGASFVCLEPWTRGIGGYSHLAADDWADSGAMGVLSPGETRTWHVTLTALGSASL